MHAPQQDVLPGGSPVPLPSSRTGSGAGLTSLDDNPLALSLLEGADMVLDLTNEGFIHTRSLGKILQARTRMLFVADPPEVLARNLPAPGDKARVQAGAALLRAGRELRVTSPHGTDLVADLTDARPGFQCGIADDPGRWDHWPSTMVLCWPKTSSGRIVIAPGDILLPFKSHVRDAVTLVIESGYITEVQGSGGDARMLEMFFEDADDDEARFLSHMGWGLMKNADWFAMADQVSLQRSPSRHPRSLWTLAFTELWERFSFYGLQGVLSFYLLYSLSEGGLALDPSIAVSIVGAYGGAVHLAQILGAWAADRLVSPRQAVLQGAIIITLGHLSLAAIPGIAGLAVGLALIALGTGALKTNISSIVGMLYAEDRDRRDAGFSYFYMAINAGAALGPLLTGLAQTTWGFHAAFALAAVGMVGGLVQYSLKMRALPAESAVVKNPIDTRGAVRALGVVAGAGLVIALVWSTGLVNSGNLVHFVTGVVLFAAAAYFIVMLRSPAVSSEEKARVRGFLPLWIASTLYYGFLFQKFTAISVFIRDRVDLFVGGWEMPAAWLSVSSPLAVILLTPLVASLWTRMGSRQPITAVKYAIGLSVIGGAYLLMLLVTTVFPGQSVPAIAVLLILALAGSSEIFVGPIGLAIATRIAPERFKNQTVALMLLTLAGGSSISGLLGTLFANIPTGAYFAIVGLAPLVLALGLAKSAKRIDSLTN
ncbi:hypothetical protein GCM10023334_035120 [Nonomuraea thailandensis]